MDKNNWNPDKVCENVENLTHILLQNQTMGDKGLDNKQLVA